MQTENNRKMCKHIKDKDSYFFPTTPSALFQGKKSAKMEFLPTKKPMANGQWLMANF